MIGKRVGGDLYLHKEGVYLADEKDIDLVSSFGKELSEPEKNWNVVRIGNDNIAFLRYPRFSEDPFPVLETSVRFDLLDGRKSVRNFGTHANPPILHRKELLVPEEFPEKLEFEALTHALEDIGVFYDTHKIGFKRQWENRLRSHGVLIKGHKVVQQEQATDVIVERHKTALARYQLSQPAQLLVRHGILRPRHENHLPILFRPYAYMQWPVRTVEVQAVKLCVLNYPLSNS